MNSTAISITAILAVCVSIVAGFTQYAKSDVTYNQAVTSLIATGMNPVDARCALDRSQNRNESYVCALSVRPMESPDTIACSMGIITEDRCETWAISTSMDPAVTACGMAIIDEYSDENQLETCRALLGISEE